MTNTHTLLCSAFTPEIADILSQLTARADGMYSGQLGDHAILATPVGIGLVEASAGITRALERNQGIREVIFLGTAGSSSATHAKVGDIVEATHFQLSDASALRGTGYVPERMGSQISVSDETSQQHLCLSPLSITRCDALADTMHSHYGHFVENLECFSIAYVCKERGIPFRAFLGITNIVGAESHKEWLEHNARVSALVQERVLRILSE